jgi:S-adenosylmethionine hydrolase
MVGPDNGLLTLAAAALGGVRAAVEISDSPECLRPISATFHGRDVFAPVAAALADGAALEAVGKPLEPAGLVMLELPQARRRDATLVAHVLATDVYGNVSLDGGGELAEQAGLRDGAELLVEGAGGPVPARFGRTFADVAPGAMLAYVDARGALALAVNGGSAASALGVTGDDEVLLRSA